MFTTFIVRPEKGTVGYMNRTSSTPPPKSHPARCEKCGSSRFPVKAYTFYHGCDLVYSAGRAPLDHSGAYRPGRIHRQVQGTLMHSICDLCILRKRLSRIGPAVIVGAMNCAMVLLLWHYWTQLHVLGERLASSSKFLALLVSLLALVVVLGLPLALLGTVLQIFECKDEIGARVAIQVQGLTPEHKKQASELKKWNEDVAVGNAASGLALNPRRVAVFWTPREEATRAKGHSRRT